MHSQTILKYLEETVATSNDSQCPALLKHFIFPYQVKKSDNFYFSFKNLKSLSAVNH